MHVDQIAWVSTNLPGADPSANPWDVDGTTLVQQALDAYNRANAGEGARLVIDEDAGWLPAGLPAEGDAIHRLATTEHEAIRIWWRYWGSELSEEGHPGLLEAVRYWVPDARDLSA